MMKTYVRKGQIIVLSIVVLGLILISLLTIIVSLIKSDIVTLILGVVVCLIFEMIFIPLLIIVYKQKLIIKEDKIIFYYKTFSHNKEYRKINHKGLIIKFNDICKIIFKKLKGDQILLADTTLVTFCLKNNVEFEATFFHFGKKQEKEIFSILKSIINKIEIN